MKRSLRILALLMAASMLIWLAGCGGDDEEEEVDEEAPTVAVAPAGGQVSANTTVTVTFNEKVKDVSITLGGVAPADLASADNKVYTFTPGAASGALAISASDEAGNALAGYAPVSFVVGEADTVAPTIVGDGCVPKDGESGVDPADIPEKFTVKFSEDMNQDSVKIDSTEPEFNAILDWVDGSTVDLMLQKYSAPNETTISIELVGTDLAGNPLADGSYEFTTMAKEQ